MNTGDDIFHDVGLDQPLPPPSPSSVFEALYQKTLQRSWVPSNIEMSSSRLIFAGYPRF